MTDSPRPGSNPYRPGAALSPRFLAGRGRELRRFKTVLGGSPELPANVRLSGLRGVGKTVLLKEFENIALNELDWAVSRVQLEPRHNTDVGLTELILGLCEQTSQQLSRTARIRENVKDLARSASGLVRVSYDDVEFSLRPVAGGSERTIVKALYEVGALADRQGKAGYLLLLDEAQVLRDEASAKGEHPLSLLIAAVNTLQEQGLPIGMVLCGLPTLRTNLLKARTYTERMFRGEEIGRLGATEARDAFVRPLDDTRIEIDEFLVDEVVAEVEGYPFFIQLCGAELWDAATEAWSARFDSSLLDQVQPDIYRRLDTDFYDGRVEALTPAEQDLLMVTAGCEYPPLRTADIHGRTGKRQGNVNVLMGRLAEQGVVYRTQKGVYEYTAPKFHDYLKRRAEAQALQGH